MNSNKRLATLGATILVIGAGAGLSVTAGLADTTAGQPGSTGTGTDSATTPSASTSALTSTDPTTATTPDSTATTPVSVATTPDPTATSPSGDVTATQAAATAGSADPALLSSAAPTTVADSGIPNSATSVAPGLSTTASGYAATGLFATAQIASDPSAGVQIGNGTDTVTLTPVGLDPNASSAVHSGNAAVFANTSAGADTIIKPTALGAQIFTQIRDATAPESYSWNVGLTSQESLRMLSDGGVAIIQPVAVAEQIAKTDSLATPADPTAPADPANANPQAAANLAAVRVAQNVANVPDPTAAAAAMLSPAAAATTGTQVTDSVQAQMSTIDQGMRVAQAEVGNGYTVIGVIAPPWAKDANGTPVPVSYSTSGSEITMTVQHQEGNYAYPIEADPWVYAGWGWWYNGASDGNDCVAWYSYVGTVGYGLLCGHWFSQDWSNDVAPSFQTNFDPTSIPGSIIGAIGAFFSNLDSEEQNYCINPLDQPDHAQNCVTALHDSADANKRAAGWFSKKSLVVKGRGAAFRHCYWVGEMSWDMGQAEALGFGFRHVDGNNEPQYYKNAGFNNNWWGAHWSTSYTSVSKRQDRFAVGCDVAADGADINPHPGTTPHPTNLGILPWDNHGLVALVNVY
jgi:hypothetical protein